MHERWRRVLLSRWAGVAAGRPVGVLIASAVLVLGSIAWTAARLEFQTDRSELVDTGRSWNAAYLEYKASFPRWDDVLVVVADDEGNTAEAFAAEAAARLREHPLVEAVADGYANEARYARLWLSQPEETWRAAWGAFRESRAVLEAASLAEFLQRLAPAPPDDASGAAGTPAAMAELAALAQRIEAAARGESPRIVDGLPAWRHLTSISGDYILLSVAPRRTEGVAAEADAIEAIRTVLDEVRASDPDFAAVEAGVTGISAVENDETAQAIRDSSLASVVATVLLAILMVATFRGVFAPLAVMAALLIGVAWSFGYLTLAVGHLQVLSVVFTVILLGLGIDFALHLLARLELIREDHESFGAALEDAFQGVGPGLITGVVTTAAAFAVTGLTDFKGVAEMGIIAGGGILLCFVAVMSIFPAILALRRDWKRSILDRRGVEGRWLKFFAPIDGRPGVTLAVAGVATAGLAWAATHVRYDPNLLNLHPPGVESVEWERRLLDDDGRSAWAALDVVDSLEEARERALAYAALPEVSGVEGVGLLFHPHREERRAEVAAVLPEVVPSVTADPAEAAQVVAGLRQGLAVQAARLEGDPRLGAIAEAQWALERLAAGLESAQADWSLAEEIYALDRQRLLAVWRALAEAAPPSLDDLPPPVRALNVSADGSRYLLRVQPEVPEGVSVLDPEQLAGFVEAARTVNPDVIGPPVQIYESSRLIVGAYTKAALWAVVIIAVILLLDFRSILDAISALLPVALGFAGMFGVLAMAGQSLNFANIIVLPLLFGIGVDAGVHVVHRWRLEPEGRPRGLSGGTGRGITLTTATTIIGFGTMMLAEHRGIRSLGFTMCVGLALTLAACFLVLPAVLAVREQGRRG